MDSMSRGQKEEQIKKAIEVLAPNKFIHMGNMNFMYDGIEYDFSAADLKQIDNIVDKQLFIN